MKISTFNSLGCYDLILQIGLPLPLVKQMLAARGIKEGDDFLVWENCGHRIEDYPDYLGTLIRASVGHTRTEEFATFITNVAMDEDNFDPEEHPDIERFP